MFDLFAGSLCLTGSPRTQLAQGSLQRKSLKGNASLGSPRLGAGVEQRGKGGEWSAMLRGGAERAGLRGRG